MNCEILARVWLHRSPTIFSVSGYCELWNSGVGLVAPLPYDIPSFRVDSEFLESAGLVAPLKGDKTEWSHHASVHGGFRMNSGLRVRKVGSWRDDFSYGCATPGSTVDTCCASVHLTFGRISHFATSTWTRILRCFPSFSRRMEECAQSFDLVLPQLQFIDRVLVVSVASQRQVSQCKLCR